MILYPVVHLPDYFTALLKSSMTAEGDAFNQFREYILDHPSLHALCKRTFKDISSDFNLSTVINALGWHGVRDRLASSFIEYNLNGVFRDSIDLNHINSALALEEKVRSYTITGYSRAFLFSFYLKMALIKFVKDDPTKQYDAFNLTERHLKYLKYVQSRTISIDWLLFLIIHLDSFLSEKRLVEILEDGEFDFDDILLMLTPEQQTCMVTNFLNYACSINDHSLFTDRRV